MSQKDTVKVREMMKMKMRKNLTGRLSRRCTRRALRRSWEPCRHTALAIRGLECSQDYRWSYRWRLLPHLWILTFYEYDETKLMNRGFFLSFLNCWTDRRNWAMWPMSRTQRERQQQRGGRHGWTQRDLRFLLTTTCEFKSKPPTP